jgi:ABC-type molybdate transport system substrate-binding protein
MISSDYIKKNKNYKIIGAWMHQPMVYPIVNTNLAKRMKPMMTFEAIITKTCATSLDVMCACIPTL